VEDSCRQFKPSIEWEEGQTILDLSYRVNARGRRGRPQSVIISTTHQGNIITNPGNHIGLLLQVVFLYFAVERSFAYAEDCGGYVKEVKKQESPKKFGLFCLAFACFLLVR
jgi:hypothetical protein